MLNRVAWDSAAGGFMWPSSGWEDAVESTRELSVVQCFIQFSILTVLPCVFFFLIINNSLFPQSLSFPSILIVSFFRKFFILRYFKIGGRNRCTKNTDFHTYIILLRLHNNLRWLQPFLKDWFKIIEIVLITLWNFSFMPSVLSCCSSRKQPANFSRNDEIRWLDCSLQSWVSRFLCVFFPREQMAPKLINSTYFLNSGMNQKHCCFWWPNCHKLFQISFDPLLCFLIQCLLFENKTMKIQVWKYLRALT